MEPRHRELTRDTTSLQMLPMLWTPLAGSEPLLSSLVMHHNTASLCCYSLYLPTIFEAVVSSIFGTLCQPGALLGETKGNHGHGHLTSVFQTGRYSIKLAPEP